MQLVAGRGMRIEILAGRIDRKMLIDLDARIDDRHRMESVLVQLREHLLRLRKGLWRPGEDAIAVHVVDIEIDHVGRDLLLAERACDLADLVLRHVRIARLLITERPQRRQCGAPGQLGVGAQHLRGTALGAAGEHVVVELAAGRTETETRCVGHSHVEMRAPGIVEEHAVARAVTQCDEKWDRLIDRPGTWRIGRCIGVPERK